MAKLTGGIAYLKAALPDDAPTDFSLPADQFPVLKNLNNGLYVAYLTDEGDHFRYLTPRDIGDVDREEFHAQCVENLAEIARKRLEIRSYKSVYVALMRGNYEASLILIDTMWDQGISHLAPNGFVAALPARDVLAFCDAESQDGIAELRQVVVRLLASPNPDHLLRPELFRREGQSWVPMP